MKIVGKVLWWDRKDLNGVIVDATGNEFYFDISVFEGKSSASLKPGQVVQFQLNTSIDNVACAKSVSIPPVRAKARLEKEFQRNSQLSFQF